MVSLVKVYCIPLDIKTTAAREAVEVGTEQNLLDGVANFNIGLEMGALMGFDHSIKFAIIHHEAPFILFKFNDR